jgi:mRNA interferase RelE/StbE
MNFEVILTPEAQTDIRHLGRSWQIRILDKLAWMGENAMLIQHQALKGDLWAGCFKYRVGDYRIIYQLDMPGNRLTILKVGHRREVYK